MRYKKNSDIFENKIRATGVSGFDFHFKCFCVWLPSPIITVFSCKIACICVITQQTSVKYDEQNSRISILYNSNLLNRNVFVFISKRKTFKHIHSALCSLEFGLVFWFALNPVNLCSFDVSSFLNNFDPFFVCILFTSCHHCITFWHSVWVEMCDVLVMFQGYSSVSWILLYFKKSIITEFIQFNTMRDFRT